jgi:hypothetical protein
MITQDVASETPPARRDCQFDYQSPDDVCNETLDEPSWIGHDSSAPVREKGPGVCEQRLPNCSVENPAQRPVGQVS